MAKIVQRKNSRSVYKPTERRINKRTNPSDPIIKELKIKKIYKEIKNSIDPIDYEIFAYCSKNYQDAFDFVVPSWSKHENVKKITVYTDWAYRYPDSKVEVRHMFEPSTDWIVGTGRRLNVIKDYSERHQGQQKNILFLDIDCYITRDPSEVFSEDFDIAITRLNSKESHANKTATAGLWFARLTPGYYNFIHDWFQRAEILKNRGVGLKPHFISYVQYSFTDVAKTDTYRYNILPISEHIYNSEHTVKSKWFDNIKKYKPKILHYKGRRFRDPKIVQKTLTLAEV